jgi:hypothetical protein
MSETVLVLPLVFVVLALLFFFGQAMTRLQRSSVTDRYEAWRQTLYAPGPGAQFAKRGRSFGDAGLLNQAFFAGNASRLDIADRSGRIDVQEPIDLVANQTLDTAVESTSPRYDPATAQQAVRDFARRAPAWWRIDLSTEHTYTVPLYQRFAGPVRHQSTRIDGDWSFASWIEQKHRGVPSDVADTLTNDVLFVGDTNDADGLRDLNELRPQALFGLYDVYYRDADQPLETLAQQGNPLASAVRGIYLNLPTYVGPTIQPELSYRLVRYQP